MFHVEMRMGMQVVREFNLSEQRLWIEFLAPLMADHDFSVEGHEFTPRQTRLKVYEGEELRPDQLGLGRAWQNAERTAADVTARVLVRAREHEAASDRAATEAVPGVASAAATELLHERLLGRLGAGPVAVQEILAAAAELMPDAAAPERLETAKRAAWLLLERDLAELTPSGSGRQPDPTQRQPDPARRSPSGPGRLPQATQRPPSGR
ncbi:MAG: hypothetical protein KGL16_07805 [Acidobacteriota bacterium]|nr:hypothetical protein [Acidobacteriota bacterium]